MNTNNENAARASGIYELARAHLTANRDAFASGDPAWLVSAWKHLLKGSPEDVNFEGERAGTLFEAIVGDIGEDAAFSGLDEVYESHGRAMTCIELARAYGAEEWPRLAMRDYLYAFDGMDEETAEAASIRAWANARIIYDARKSSKESEGLAA